ncbi:hypothetical protein HNQ79_006674 [Streptomyces candidus]|uniref:Uncharacterized protein n=1 Tax=Streptomyces candidus TaxID=67283 RepID=A0A7X0LUJ1_9ACTN|nr:hypothetical protein [Streptomyces candidus]
MAVKTIHCVVVGVYAAPVQDDEAVTVVANLADHLRSTGT